MSDQEDLRILKETREYFLDRNHWTTDYYGRFSGGDGITEDRATEECERRGESYSNAQTVELELVRDSATCRCLVGELTVAANSWQSFDMVERHFYNLFKELGVKGIAAWHQDLYRFNDDQGYSAVLVALGEAIEKLEARIQTGPDHND